MEDIVEKIKEYKRDEKNWREALELVKKWRKQDDVDITMVIDLAENLIKAMLEATVKTIDSLEEDK